MNAETPPPALWHIGRDENSKKCCGILKFCMHSISLTYMKIPMKKIMERNTSGTVFTHKHTQRLFNLIIHTHICGAVHTLCLDHVHLNLSRLYTTVHSVVHILQAALIFLNLNKFKWVAAFLLRLVHTLCSDQLFGSAQVLLKMANVSIVSVDPHQRLVDKPNLQLHYFSLKPGSVHFSCIIFLWNQVLYTLAKLSPSRLITGLETAGISCSQVSLTNGRFMPRASER